MAVSHRRIYLYPDGYVYVAPRVPSADCDNPPAGYVCMLTIAYDGTEAKIIGDTNGNEAHTVH